MTANHHEKTPLIAAVMTGILASSCCIGPLLVTMLGLGSASMFVGMEAYRPLWGVVTLALMGWAAWRHWQARKTCLAQGCPPNKPVTLWLLGSLALLILLSPSWLPY